MMDLKKYCRIKWEHARDLKRKGAYQEAEKELTEALEEQPDHPLLTASLADLYLRQDRLTETRVLAEAILSRDPQYPQALVVLGEVFFKENNLHEALQCFRQASQKDPSPYLNHRVIRTLREMKRYEEALEILDSLLVRDRENILFLKEKALILNRMKQGDEALRLYERVKKLDPNDLFVRKEIYRLKGLKRPDEKNIKELETVVNLPSRKDDPQLHGLLGQKLKDAGRLNEAAAEFHTAWQLDPNNFFFLKQEGYCHYHLKAYPEAIQALSHVFRKDPNDYIIKKTLERMYVRTQDIDGFISLLEEILKDHPRNVKLIGTLKKVITHAQRTSP